MIDRTLPDGLPDQYTANMAQPLQAQAPICPFCFDDHSSLKDCEPKDLKKELLLRKLDDFLMCMHNEKQDASFPDKIKKMIRWL